MRTYGLNFVYILANKTNKVFYIGVTNDLIRRIWEHKNHVVKGFTKKYNVEKLVYYEKYESITDAISKEKYLKGKKRKYKINIIIKNNPHFRDLYTDIIQ